MAVFQGLPGVEVTVLINGVRVREYQDDDIDAKSDELSQYQASKTISKYIESLTGEEFSIELSVSPPYKFNCEALGFQVYVDGSNVRSPILEKKNFHITAGWKSSVTGIVSRDVGDEWKIQKFKFASIETTVHDDKIYDLKQDIARISEVGEIAVWVYRESNVQPKGMMENRDFLGMGEDAVHEKALKGQAKSHGTALGEAQTSSAVKKYTVKMIDGEGQPIAIYKIKYRSREVLQSLLIVPPEPEIERPSAPTPNSARRQCTTASPDPERIDLDTATPEEKQLMAAYLASLRDQASPQVKTESPSIKRERGTAGRSRKRIKQEGAVVIDLTED